MSVRDCVDDEEILKVWNANPSDFTGDNTIMNGIYSLRLRCTGKGYVGMFRYLGPTPRGHVGKCLWEVIDDTSGRWTSIGTWLGRTAEYHAWKCFATAKEAMTAAIDAAFEHALNNSDGWKGKDADCGWTQGTWHHDPLIERNQAQPGSAEDE